MRNKIILGLMVMGLAYCGGGSDSQILEVEDTTGEVSEVKIRDLFTKEDDEDLVVSGLVGESKPEQAISEGAITVIFNSTNGEVSEVHYRPAGVTVDALWICSADEECEGVSVNLTDREIRFQNALIPAYSISGRHEDDDLIFNGTIRYPEPQKD